MMNLHLRLADSVFREYPAMLGNEPDIIPNFSVSLSFLD